MINKTLAAATAAICLAGAAHAEQISTTAGFWARVGNAIMTAFYGTTDLNNVSAYWAAAHPDQTKGSANIPVYGHGIITNSNGVITDSNGYVVGVTKLATGGQYVTTVPHAGQALPPSGYKLNGSH